MAYDYIKSISGDFPNAVVSPSLLKYQIDNDGGITTALESINTSGDVCTMTFASEPSSGEKTAIDALITAHTSAAIANWNRGCACCGPPAMTTTERDAITGTIPDGSMIWNSTDSNLQYYDGAEWQSIEGSVTFDFTGTDYDTKAECQAVGFKFSDDDIPFPDTIVNTVSGTWSHTAGKGWIASPSVDTQGPALLFPLCRSHDWELAAVITYEPTDVAEQGAIKIAAITPTNHYSFLAMASDSSAVAKSIESSLYTNDGDDTNTARHLGDPETVVTTVDWTIKMRNKNGAIQVYDDEDDTWHDYTGRQSTGISYTPSHIAIQAYKYTELTYWPAYLKSFTLTYL